MKQVVLEVATDAAIGVGSISVLLTEIEFVFKAIVFIGTCVLLFYRIKKAIRESK